MVASPTGTASWPEYHNANMAPSAIPASRSVWILILLLLLLLLLILH
jgi:hypothetical protein